MKSKESSRTKCYTVTRFSVNSPLTSLAYLQAQDLSNTASCLALAGSSIWKGNNHSRDSTC